MHQCRCAASLGYCQCYQALLTAAILFSLRDPRILSTVVGISKPEWLVETLAALASPADLWDDLASMQEYSHA